MTETAWIKGLERLGCSCPLVLFLALPVLEISRMSLGVLGVKHTTLGFILVVAPIRHVAASEHGRKLLHGNRTPGCFPMFEQFIVGARLALVPCEPRLPFAVNPYLPPFVSELYVVTAFDGVALGMCLEDVQGVLFVGQVGRSPWLVRCPALIVFAHQLAIVRYGPPDPLYPLPVEEVVGARVHKPGREPVGNGSGWHNHESEKEN